MERESIHHITMVRIIIHTWTQTYANINETERKDKFPAQ